MFTIRQLVDNALDSSTKGQIESSKRRTFKANLLKPTTLIEFPDSIALISVRFIVEVRVHRVPISEPMFGNYAGVEGSLLRVAAVRFERDGSSFDLNVYFNTLESE